jgi:hypothetical protein
MLIKKKLRRGKKKRGEDIPARGGEEKRIKEKGLRREAKEKKGCKFFLQKGKREEEKE